MDFVVLLILLSGGMAELARSGYREMTVWLCKMCLIASLHETKQAF